MVIAEYDKECDCDFCIEERKNRETKMKHWVTFEPKTKEDFDEVFEYLIENRFITREQYEENKRKIKEDYRR